MRILEMAQSNDEWDVWRKAGVGSSEASAIMGVSPYTTYDELLKRKTGQLAKQRWSAKTQRGHDLEPVARELYHRLRNINTRPVCVIHDVHNWLRASLDGLSDDNRRVVEIKCINKGDHLLALQGQVPPQYVPQVQHQLLVTGLDHLDYWSYSESSAFVLPQRVALVEVTPDREYMQMLFEAEREFSEKAGLLN